MKWYGLIFLAFTMTTLITAHATPDDEFVPKTGCNEDIEHAPAKPKHQSLPDLRDNAVVPTILGMILKTDADAVEHAIERAKSPDYEIPEDARVFLTDWGVISVDGSMSAAFETGLKKLDEQRRADGALVAPVVEAPST